MKIKKYKKLFEYMFCHKLKVLLVILCMVISQSCAVVLPSIMAKIVDIGIKQNGFENVAQIGALSSNEIIANQINYILKMGAIMLAITLLSVAFSVISGYLVARISSDISSKLRRDIIKKVIYLPAENVDKFSSSSMITRATSDVEHVKSLILTSIYLLMPPFMIIGGVYMALRTCKSMSPIVAIGTLFACVTIFVCIKLVTPKLKKVQILNDKFNRIVRERLSGLVTIRIFNNDAYECGKFEKCNSELTDITLFVNKIVAFVMPILTTIMNFVHLSIIWFGAKEIAKSSVQVGDVMAFIQYTALIITAFFMLAMIIGNIPQALISADRVLEILQEKPCYEKPKNTEKNIKFNNIEMKNVSFKYPGAEEFALENINFKALHGQKVGIIGPTGSGKSTFLKLLLGEYRCTSGEILIDGVNTNFLGTESVSKNIGYVPQIGMMFEDTLASNLRFGNEDITDDMIYNALNIVQMGHLAASGELQKKVDHEGMNFSGGERQRLMIARAIAKPKKVYVFDDSFSKLDYVTEKKLRLALFEYAKGSLIFIISQRVSAVKDCDKIIVLDDGIIKSEGTHDELIQKNEFYSSLVRLQFGGEDDE